MAIEFALYVWCDPQLCGVPEDLEAKLEIVAKAERRPLAGLCVHLIEQALELPR